MMGQFNKEERVSNVFAFSRNGEKCRATIRDLGTFEFAAEDADHVIHRLRQSANAIEQMMAAAEGLSEANVRDRQMKDTINRYNGRPGGEERAAARVIDRAAKRVEKAIKSESAADRRARLREERRRNRR